MDTSILSMNMFKRKQERLGSKPHFRQSRPQRARRAHTERPEQTPQSLIPHSAWRPTHAFLLGQLSRAALVLIPLTHAVHCAAVQEASTDSDDTQPARAPSKTPPRQAPVRIEIHPGESWYAFRAAELGLTADQAALRDEEITDEGPPTDRFWDDQLAIEVASIFRGLCNECHGGRRRIEDAPNIPPPEMGWGQTEGPFYDRILSHRQAFRSIFYGGRPKGGKRSKMPAWGNKLSREQIWGLIYYVEYASSQGNRR